MSRIQQYQSNFTTGELDPLLRGRIDLKQYYSGVSVAKNVLFEPQGGFSRRPGLAFVDGAFNNANNGIFLVPFEFSTTQNFLLVFVLNISKSLSNTLGAFRIKIYKQAVAISNINGSGNSYIDYTTGPTSDNQPIEVKKINYTQSADTLLVFHENLAPFKVQRGSSDQKWTVEQLSLTSPKYAYLLSKTSSTGTDYNRISATITPDAVEGSVTVTASATIFRDTETGTAQAGTNNTITLASTASSTNDFYNGSYVTITSGTGSGQKRVVVDYDGSTKVATVYDTGLGYAFGETWDTNPTSSSGYEISGHIDQYINVKNGFGRLKIVEVSSGTVVKGLTTIPFYEKDVAIASDDWELEQGYEDAWSSTRGYPRTATFHEGRLYIGGSATLPNVLFGSKVGDFLNFSTAEGLDDDALQVTLGTDSVNAINALRSGRDLQIFTSDAEFFVPQADLDPITPSNIVIKSATRRGSKPFIKPQAAEGGTLFIQRQGKSIREMLFSDVELSYVANNISLLSSHLIIDPQKLALRPATDTTEGDLLLVINGTSSTGYRSASTGFTGGIAAFVLNKGQNIVAPSFFETNGTFIDVAVDLDTIYVIVKRDTSYFLEKFDEDFTTDSSKQRTSSFSQTMSFMNHLVGDTVKIIRDDIIDPDQVVGSGGSITFAGDIPTNYVEVGLDYSVEVKTMPFEPNLPSGTVQSQKRRVVEVTPVLYRSQNIAINGTQVSLTTLPSSGTGAVPTFTGPKKTMGFRGYDRDAQITITQTQPVFLTVLSLDYKVAVGQ